MFIDLILGLLFVGSCFTLWYGISRKIPEVVAIHDDVITQRLHEDSARLRIFLLHFKTFYKEPYYHIIFWNFLGKIFYKLHIFVLKIDNALIAFLKKIRTRGGSAPVLSGLAGLAASEQEMHEQATAEKVVVEEKSPAGYWSILKEDAAALSVQTSRKRHVEGVRVRTRKTPVKSEMAADKKDEPT